MGEAVKATIVGTIIIGIFMIICTKMASNAVLDIAKKTKIYVEAQKDDAKRIVKQEKPKIKDIVWKAAILNADKKK